MWKWIRFERESWLALTEKESPELIVMLSSIKGWPSSVWPTSQSNRTLTSAWSVLSWSWSVYLLVTNVTGKCGDQARKERSLIHFVGTLAFAKAGLIARGGMLIGQSSVLGAHPRAVLRRLPITQSVYRYTVPVCCTLRTVADSGSHAQRDFLVSQGFEPCLSQKTFLLPNWKVSDHTVTR